MQKRFLKLPCADIYYWHNEFNKKRKNLVLVHGFRGDHHGLAYVAKYLDDDYNIFVPDLPGFGESGEFKFGKHSLENYVLFLEEFVDSLDLKKKPIIIGHSMGSIVSSKFAADHPKIIDKKLILLSPIAAQPVSGNLLQLTKKLIEIFSKMPEKIAKPITSSKIVSASVSIKMTKTKDKKLKRKIWNEHSKYFGNFSSNKSMLEGLITSYSNNVGMFAEDIKNKVLLVAGVKDELSKPEKQVKLAEKFKNSELKFIEGTGHLIQYETPDQVAKYIKEFIK